MSQLKLIILEEFDSFQNTIKSAKIYEENIQIAKCMIKITLKIAFINKYD